MSGGGIFAGTAVKRSRNLFGALPQNGDNRAVYIGAAEDVTDAQLQEDDVNTMSAAFVQAAQTNQSVTVKLTDGSSFTANPDGSSSSSDPTPTAAAAKALPAVAASPPKGAPATIQSVPVPHSSTGLLLGLAAAAAATVGAVVVIRRRKKAKRNPRRSRRRR